MDILPLSIFSFNKALISKSFNSWCLAKVLKLIKSSSSWNKQLLSSSRYLITFLIAKSYPVEKSSFLFPSLTNALFPNLFPLDNPTGLVLKPKV